MSYTLAEAIEVCKNAAIKHRHNSLRYVIELALDVVRCRVGSNHLPKGWRPHLEEAVESAYRR